jgi:hypothetical protein
LHIACVGRQYNDSRVGDSIGVERGVLLAAVGMKPNGQKEIIGARLADSESEKDWTSFLIDMKSRGLAGKNIECIATDGGPGCIAALKTIYPYKKHQRCIAHKLATEGNSRGEKIKIRIEQHTLTAGTWFAAWLYTIGFLHLNFGRGVLAIVLWPYYLGAHFAR